MGQPCKSWRWLEKSTGSYQFLLPVDKSSIFQVGLRIWAATLKPRRKLLSDPSETRTHSIVVVRQEPRLHRPSMIPAYSKSHHPTKIVIFICVKFTSDWIWGLLCLNLGMTISLLMWNLKVPSSSALILGLLVHYHHKFMIIDSSLLDW